MKSWILFFATLSLPCFAMLTPFEEGTYQIRIECRDNEPKLCHQVEGNHVMTLMNSPDGKNISVFIPKDFGYELFFFNSAARVLGSRIEGAGHNAYNSRAELILELREGQISGWIRDPRFENDLRITGRQTENIGSVFLQKSDPPVEMGDVVGVYYGQMTGISAVKLVLHRSLTQTDYPILASATINNIVTLPFLGGRLDSETGVVTLYGDAGYGATNQWVLKLRTDGEKRRMEGFAMIVRRGTISNVSLVRSEDQ